MRVIFFNKIQLTVLIFFISFTFFTCLRWWIKYHETLIIICTPTLKNVTRLADITRLSQTLMHLNNLHWIVIEDGQHTSPAVEKVLKRSGIKYTYLSEPTGPEFESRKVGWAQRNKALAFIRQRYLRYKGNAVVYFGDDDNTYDLRLFNNYIRNVKTVGMWAVGLAGKANVETPVVKNGKIIGFRVVFEPERKFATDMAGFAVNLELILSSTATFHHKCKVYNSEDCFLRQLNIELDQVQPFGVEQDSREILIWHTKTYHSGGRGGYHGYTVIA